MSLLILLVLINSFIFKILKNNKLTNFSNCYIQKVFYFFNMIWIIKFIKKLKMEDPKNIPAME